MKANDRKKCCDNCKFYIKNCCACLRPELDEKKAIHKDNWQWCRKYEEAEEV